MKTTIPLSSGSYPMAFSPYGLTGYVGNGYADCGTVNGIHRINLFTNKKIGFIPTSVPVSDFAVSPRDGLALVSGGDRIVVVDLASRVERGSVQCGLAPCTYLYAGGIAFNATGTRAYMIDFHGNTLSTIDTDPRSLLYLHELSRVPVPAERGQNAWGIQIQNDRATVVVMGEPSHAVSFDVTTDTPAPISLDAVGNFAYEFAVSPRPPQHDDCRKNRWFEFEEFRNQERCLTFWWKGDRD
jgi:DNA-binding beta-propeller fold protein YncE